MAVLSLWVFLALIVGAMGSDKTIGFWGGFLWSLLLSPVIGFFIVIASKSNQQKRIEDQTILNQQKQTQILSQMSQRNNQESIADQLTKLKRLLDEKAITEEEYQKAKSKLISSFD